MKLPILLSCAIIPTLLSYFQNHLRLITTPAPKRKGLIDSTNYDMSLQAKQSEKCSLGKILPRPRWYAFLT